MRVYEFVHARLWFDMFPVQLVLTFC